MSKKTGPAKAEDTPDFEKALAELEQIVERLEQGELSLDESLKQFERGIGLARNCQTALQHAEQKVDILLRKNGEPEPFVAEVLAASVTVTSSAPADSGDETGDE